jgi:hypothetical protein
MNKGDKKIIVAFIAIALIAGGFYEMQIGNLRQIGIPPINLSGNTGTPPNNGTTATDYSNGIGKYQLDFKAANAADSAALTVGTNIDIWALHYVNGQYSAEGATYNPAQTNYFTATPSDNGNMWIEVKPHSSQNYFINYEKILATQSLPGYVVGVQYISDPLGDGHKDFIFQFNLKGQPVPSAGSYPVLSFQAWAMGYDTSFGGLVSVPTMTNVSEIELVSVPKYEEFDATMSAEKLGIALYKVVVQIGNSSSAVTDQTKLQIKSLSIPNLGTIDGTSFDQAFTTTDIRYTYTISSSLYGADYIMLPANGNNKFPFNLQVQCTLSSGDQIPVSITLYYMDTTGTGHSSAYGIYFNEGAAATGIA